MPPTMNFYADPPSIAGAKLSHTEISETKLEKASQEISNDMKQNEKKKEYKIEIKWLNVFIFTYLHIAAVYGFMLPKLGRTIVIGWVIGILSGIGTTVGAHRLFTHRTFKPNMKMKILMVILQTMSGQEPVLHWARDHRVHHKFTDTNADPYNSRRGFFFCHIGWLMCKKHPDVIEQGKKVDMSDLENDPVLQWQKKWYIPIAIFWTFIFPPMTAIYFGEAFTVAWHGNIYRYLIGLHLVWSVNSVAHLWGSKPYDKNISPTDTYFVGIGALGEGWHNYHHIFPWDYKTAEIPGFWRLNISTVFIDFFAWLGWATELKTVPESMIKSRVLRTGDGSHKLSKQAKRDKNNNENIEDDGRDIEHFWGWGDKEMTQQDMKKVKIL